MKRSRWLLDLVIVAAIVSVLLYVLHSVHGDFNRKYFPASRPSASTEQ